MERFDLVVIGAGIFGLPVAKTYFQVNPSARLLVLDAGKTIGGTWSKERIYDGLVTNNLVGSFEYNDFPMDFETFRVPPGAHIPGMVVHKYLTLYAEHFGFFNKIRFQSQVTQAEMKDDGSWIISYEIQKEHDIMNMKLAAKKIVLATGLTSIPNIPQIAGSREFGGPIFHFKDYQSYRDDMKLAKNILVLGGSKSAVDAVYLNAAEGRHVDWIIRGKKILLCPAARADLLLASGRGPAWIATPYVTPANLAFEGLVTTRIMSWFSPSLYSDSFPLIRRFLHNTKLGRVILRGFFKIVNYDIINRAKYNEHPDTKKLLPNSNIEWCGSNVSIFNQPTDFFSLIRKGTITIHRADVTSLSRNTIHLSSGEDIQGDILIYATGWKALPSFPFTPTAISQRIGISTTPPSDPQVSAADAEILRRFPILADQPPPAGPNAAKYRAQTHYILHRGTVPPSLLVSQAQGLWITAFFGNKLSVALPEEAEAERAALLESCFWRRRAPNGLGPRSADLIFEVMPFLDMLLRDLGLRTERKGGWWREVFESYGAGDYRGMLEEWIEKEKVEEGGK